VNVTLPAIAQMKPYIDKSAPERAKAFATMGLTDATCAAAVTDAIAARESVSLKARGQSVRRHDRVDAERKTSLRAAA